MEVAVAVAVAVAVGVVLVMVGAVVLRRVRREAQSVAGYRQTLDVLGHLGGGDRSVLRRGEEGSGTPRVSSYQRPRDSDSVGFDDFGTEDRRKSTAAPGVSPRRDRSLLAMERPARRLGVPVLAVAAILAAGGAAAYLAVRAHDDTRPPRRAASSHSQHHKVPRTTLPAQYTPVASTSSTATYAPTTSTYSLTIGATTSDCWMSVTGANGTTVLAQTFAAGATDSVKLTGHSTVVIGAPSSARMTIGGVPVVLPTGIAGPFTVTLDPA